MTPQLVEINIRADCPECGVPTTFEYKEAGAGNEFGTVIVNRPHHFSGRPFSRIFYKLYRCTVCSRPGVGTLHVNNNYEGAVLESFWPSSLRREPIPLKIPEGIVKEFREAEICMSAQAWRGASALLRSTLEKVLVANGFSEKDLYKKIEAAATAGVITSARRRRAQDLVRVLGNDVLHEEWREVEPGEAESSHHYVSRILEDLYDDRQTVEELLHEAGREFTPAA